MITKSSQIIELLSNTFGFDVIEDPVFQTDALLLSAEEAYEFSLITGAEYLTTPTGYSVKGRMEVAIHRSVFQNGAFIYTPGLFGRDIDANLIEGESIRKQYRTHPEIFTGFKTLIVYDASSDSCIEEELYKKIKMGGKNPSEYIVYFSFNRGSNNEPLYEYIASKIFRQKGCMTENQAPWFNQNYIFEGKKLNGGIPDFSAYSSYDLALISEKFNMDHINIQTTSGIFLKGDRPGKTIPKHYELSIGEAKVSSHGLKQAANQLNKYGATKLPNQLYLILPDIRESPDDRYGYVTVLDNEVIFATPKQLNEIDPPSQKEDERWISNILKMYLLSNLSFDLILKYLKKKMKNLITDKITSKDLVISVCSSSMDEIVEYVDENIIYEGVW